MWHLNLDISNGNWIKYDWNNFSSVFVDYFFFSSSFFSDSFIFYIYFLSCFYLWSRNPNAIIYRFLEFCSIRMDFVTWRPICMNVESRISWPTRWITFGNMITLSPIMSPFVFSLNVIFIVRFYRGLLSRFAREPKRRITRMLKLANIGHPLT